MFLFQKYGYTTKHITTFDDVLGAVEVIQAHALGYLDTESTGLNIMKDTPFLFVVGVGKNLYSLDLTLDYSKEYLGYLTDALQGCERVFAHNAGFDWHMLYNYGVPLPEGVDYADTQTVVRLTTPADSLYRVNLEEVGSTYVDSSSKFAGAVIKQHISKLVRERKRALKDYYDHKYRDRRKSTYLDVPFGTLWKVFDCTKRTSKRIKYIDDGYEWLYEEFDTIFKTPNYYDVYLEKPQLMINYAYDDLVIMMEYNLKALPVLAVTDPDFNIFNQECDLIVPTCELERVGLPVDLGYLIDSRHSLSNYRDVLYGELREKSGIPDLTVGQHKVIMSVFAKKFGITIFSANSEALDSIRMNNDPRYKVAVEIADLIYELRTVDKWLTTYIDGVLNRVIDGRIHTTIHNSGTVTGRVTSNLQQQPSRPLIDREGNEVFHPRRMYVPDEGYHFVVMDYSQQELRVQAYETILLTGGDLNLCRAYIPLQTTSLLTGEDFDPTVKELLDRWDSSEWVLKEDPNVLWTPSDVHEATTLNAFPEMNNDVNHPDFKENRNAGKMANFLKNYGGGRRALQAQLKDSKGRPITEEVAIQLDEAYYKAFPTIRMYQHKVVEDLTKRGYTENAYGRRYYLKQSDFFYKASNYKIQGASADMVKTAVRRISQMIKDNGFKTRLMMTIHDELDFMMKDEEIKTIVPMILDIMTDTPEIPYIPMVVDVEGSKKSWADVEVLEWQ